MDDSSLELDSSSTPSDGDDPIFICRNDFILGILSVIHRAIIKKLANYLLLITFADITNFISIQKHPFTMKAHDVMSVNIVAAKEEVTAIEILTRIVLEGYNGMPIINERGAVIGIVTTLDILKALKDNKNLEKLSAKDIMT